MGNDCFHSFQNVLSSGFLCVCQNINSKQTVSLDTTLLNCNFKTLYYAVVYNGTALLNY